MQTTCSFLQPCLIKAWGMLDHRGILDQYLGTLHKSSRNWFCWLYDMPSCYTVYYRKDLCKDPILRLIPHNHTDINKWLTLHAWQYSASQHSLTSKFSWWAEVKQQGRNGRTAMTLYGNRFTWQRHPWMWFQLQQQVRLSDPRKGKHHCNSWLKRLWS